MQDPINIEKIAELGNVSTATVYRWIKHPRFPKPAKVPRTADRGPATVKCWDRQQVINWMVSESKIHEVNAEETTPEELESRLTELEEESNHMAYMIGGIAVLVVALALFRYFG